MTIPFRSVRLAALTTLFTWSAAGCAGATAAGGAPATVAPDAGPPPVDGALAAPQGEVEQTTFAADLNVVLLAMTRLPTGVYYRDIEEGTGVPATAGREVLVSYVAMLPDGTEIDRTAPGARPLAYPARRDPTRG